MNGRSIAAKSKVFFLIWSNGRLIRFGDPFELDARLGYSKRLPHIFRAAGQWMEEYRQTPDGYEVVLYGDVVQSGKIEVTPCHKVRGDWVVAVDGLEFATQGALWTEETSDYRSVNAARTDSFGGGDGCDNSTQENGD